MMDLVILGLLLGMGMGLVVIVDNYWER